MQFGTRVGLVLANKTATTFSDVGGVITHTFHASMAKDLSKWEDRTKILGSNLHSLW